MNSSRTALVTGASGLLGRCLTSSLNGRGIRVLAQYYSHPLAAEPLLSPLPGDLSSPEGVERFWLDHRPALSQVDCYFCNYGPLTYKLTSELEYADFEADYSAQVAPLVTLTRRMREQGRLTAVMVSGLAEARSGKGFRRILTQACAKVAVEMIVESWRLVWPDFRACSFPVPSLAGARVPRGGVEEADPAEVAERMVGALIDDAGET